MNSPVPLRRSNRKKHALSGFSPGHALSTRSNPESVPVRLSPAIRPSTPGCVRCRQTGFFFPQAFLGRAWDRWRSSPSSPPSIDPAPLATHSFAMRTNRRGQDSAIDAVRFDVEQLFGRAGGEKDVFLKLAQRSRRVRIPQIPSGREFRRRLDTHRLQLRVGIADVNQFPLPHHPLVSLHDVPIVFGENVVADLGRPGR